jgi:hypothetical protein
MIRKILNLKPHTSFQKDLSETNRQEERKIDRRKGRYRWTDRKTEQKKRSQVRDA